MCGKVRLKIFHQEEKVCVQCKNKSGGIGVDTHTPPQHMLEGMGSEKAGNMACRLCHNPLVMI